MCMFFGVWLIIRCFDSWVSLGIFFIVWCRDIVVFLKSFFFWWVCFFFIVFFVDDLEGEFEEFFDWLLGED